LSDDDAKNGVGVSARIFSGVIPFLDYLVFDIVVGRVGVEGA
jgi:hypothetical protein